MGELLSEYEDTIDTIIRETQLRNKSLYEGMKKLREDELSGRKKKFITEYLRQNDILFSRIKKLYEVHYANELARYELFLMAYRILFRFHRETPEDTKEERTLREALASMLAVNTLIDVNALDRAFTEYNYLKSTIHSGMHSSVEKMRAITFGQLPDRTPRMDVIMDVIGTVFDNTIVSNEIMPPGENEEIEEMLGGVT
jgi:hypothetical protein